MFFLKKYSSLFPGITLAKYKAVMTKEGFTKIVNLMTHGTRVIVLGRGQIIYTNHVVKMHYFIKNLLLQSQAQVGKTKYIVMMTNKESTKIVNIMTPGARVHVLRQGHITYMVKCIISFYTQAQFRQRKYKVTMTLEGST